MSYIFTSESVSAGHPDKICDQISDAVLDACLVQDKNSRVACETMVKNNNVILGGEITSTAEIDYEQIARNVVKDIGYDHEGLGFSYDSFRFTNYISEQSQDISKGIAQGKQLGSGDQGIMFGYACRETSELMPLPIALAHQLTLKHEYLRHDRSLGLRPDAKSQVAVEYNDNYQPQRIDSIVFSSQHDPDLSLEQLRELIREEIIYKTSSYIWSFGALTIGYYILNDKIFEINESFIKTEEEESAKESEEEESEEEEDVVVQKKPKKVKRRVVVVQDSSSSEEEEVKSEEPAELEPPKI